MVIALLTGKHRPDMWAPSFAKPTFGVMHYKYYSAGACNYVDVGETMEDGRRKLRLEREAISFFKFFLLMVAADIKEMNFLLIIWQQKGSGLSLGEVMLVNLTWRRGSYYIHPT